MESWQHVLRVGFLPQFTTAGLRSLLKACQQDDCRLAQGSTTTPPPLICVRDWECEACCPVSWTGWQGGENYDCLKVGEVEEYFARACFECDKILQEAAACRHFLNWADDTPRHTMLSELANEVARELEAREGSGPATANDGSFAAYALSPL